MKCRHCSAELKLKFVDLGSAPPSNSYLTEAALHKPEKYYPLRVLVCNECWLVQTDDFAECEEFFSSDYAYFSSFSDSWLTHSRNYVESMSARFSLSDKSHVVEIAANDGYLLQYFCDKGIPCLGIEPTASTAAAAREKGVEIVESFFGRNKARELLADGKAADLMVANNVLAHVPDINDFVGGFCILLKKNGVVTFEFPYLINLIENFQFDTIYHEHFSYLSLSVVHRILEKNGLKIFDVEELSTHGGSLRVYAQRADTGTLPVEHKVSQILLNEGEGGVNEENFYLGFQKNVEKIKNELLEFLINSKKSGKKVVGYGAAAKGNTFLNYSGVRSDLINYIVDRNPAKQGKYMPGSRIPILGEAQLKSDRPDVILILPWNIKEEVFKQLEYVKGWGAELVIAVPQITKILT
jgi:SAM-dependent methyltransferase